MVRVDIVALFQAMPWERFEEKLPGLAQRARELGVEPHDIEHSVFATRRMAREVLGRLPDGQIVLDCARVDVMSAPFAHELLMQRRDLTIENANEDVQDTWDYVTEKINGGERS